MCRGFVIFMLIQRGAVVVPFVFPFNQTNALV